MILANKLQIIFLCFVVACLTPEMVQAQEALSPLTQEKSPRQNVFDLMRVNGKSSATPVNRKEIKRLDLSSDTTQELKIKAPKIPEKAGKLEKPDKNEKINGDSQKTGSSDKLKVIKRQERSGEIVRDIKKFENQVNAPISDEKIIQRAIDDLQNISFYKRKAAENKLVEFGVKSLPRMIKAYKRLDFDLHLMLTKVAIKIGREGEEHFLEALNLQNNSIRWNAAKVLGNIGSEKSVEPLIRALNDPVVRPTAVDSLGMLGDKRAILPLQGLLEVEDEFVKMLVKRSLVQLGVKIQLLH